MSGIEKAFANLPDGINGFALGMVVGALADKVIQYVYVSAVEGKEMPENPLGIAWDDMAILLFGLIVAWKSPAFAGGFMFGSWILSGFLR